VKTCFDKAGRPKSVQNPDTPTVYYASNVLYGVHGGMTSATFGDNAVLETWQYSNQSQPRQVKAVHGSTTLLQVDTWYCPTSETCLQNNGNVLRREIYDGGATFTQSFVGLYDGLNRLTGMTESGTGLWQTYDHDRWGNRAVTGGYVPGAGQTPQALTAYNTSTNRWMGSGVGYDNRGNQTSLPARSFTFDGESRLATAQYSTEPTQ